jgi:hypothetical protein
MTDNRTKNFGDNSQASLTARIGLGHYDSGPNSANQSTRQLCAPFLLSGGRALTVLTSQPAELPR